MIILGQRQTALVAKQAANVDVLTRGRLRLGIGTGWNAGEYEALGENFADRGIRSEEQIDVMRKLWADEVIDYDGRWHKIDAAGINPLPTRMIPVWLGGMAPQVMDRVGRIADGWFPFFNNNLAEQIATVHEVAKQNDRDPADIGIECMLPLDDAGPKTRDRLKGLQDLGVTHTACVTMNASLETPADHVDAIKRWWDVAGDFAS